MDPSGYVSKMLSIMPLPNNYENPTQIFTTTVTSDGLNTAGYRWIRHTHGSGDDGLKYTANGVGADGKPTHAEFQAKYDGKDYPFKSNPDADTLSYKRIDANTLEATLKLSP